MTVTAPLYQLLIDLHHANLSPAERAELQPWFDRLGKQVIEMPETVIERIQQLHEIHCQRETNDL